MARPIRRIAVFLRALDNEYQALQKADLHKRAMVHGFSTAVFDANNDAARQCRQLEEALHDPPRGGYGALLVNPVQEVALKGLAVEAARRGVGWVSLNRLCDYVRELRHAYPRLPMVCIDPDQRQIGYIQASQFFALLPNGGTVFYVCGPLSTSSARLRLVGAETALAGGQIRLVYSSADWSGEGGYDATKLWLRTNAPLEWRRCIVGAQNDSMAIGALKALSEEAKRRGQPGLAQTPITGCDGLPGCGQRLVGAGTLAATVIVPTTAGRGVDLLASSFETGTPPADDVALEVASFPAFDVIARTRPRTTPPRQKAGLARRPGRSR